MKRKLLIYGSLALAAGAFLWACQRDKFGADDPNAVEPTLTVAEARDFFEYQMAQVQPTLTRLPHDRPVGMMPGDFTPLWDKARIGANREMDGADVPIDPTFIFTAVFREVTPAGDTLRRTVDIVQKLIVNSWRDHPEWNGMYVYIATIIPTPDYYAWHRNYGRQLPHMGSKEGLSGLIVYHTLEGRFVNADRYRSGVLSAQVYNPDGAGKTLAEAVSLLEPNAHFYGGTPAMYSRTLEADDVFVTACRLCGRQDCHCQASGAGCYCNTIGNEGKPENPNPGGVIIPPGTGGGTDVGGGGGGGGGIGGPTQTGYVIPQIQLKDCGGQAGQNAAGAQAIYGAFNNAGLQKFINDHIGEDKEWGVALNYNAQTGRYEFGRENSGESGVVHIPTIYGNPVNTAALFHTHPRSEQPQSITDVIGLIETNQKTQGQTHTSFVAIKKDPGIPPIIYAIQIENRAIADAFADRCNDNLKYQMTQELQNINNKILQAGGTMDESYAYTMSYLLNRYNTGVKILKCESGNFKQKEAIVSDNSIIRSTCK